MRDTWIQYRLSDGRKMYAKRKRAGVYIVTCASGGYFTIERVKRGVVAGFRWHVVRPYLPREAERFPTLRKALAAIHRDNLAIVAALPSRPANTPDATGQHARPVRYVDGWPVYTSEPAARSAESAEAAYTEAARAGVSEAEALEAASMASAEYEAWPPEAEVLEAAGRLRVIHITGKDGH